MVGLVEFRATSPCIDHTWAHYGVSSRTDRLDDHRAYVLYKKENIIRNWHCTELVIRILYFSIHANCKQTKYALYWQCIQQTTIYLRETKNMHDTKSGWEFGFMFGNTTQLVRKT